MNKMIRMLLVLLLALSGCTTKPSEPKNQPEVDYSSIESLAQQQAEVLVSTLGAMSVQYALMDEGKIVVSGQAGVFSTKQERVLSAYDLYCIGSVSKIFTAAAAMKLQEQGILDLNQTVTYYLPEFVMADERYQQITVRMLLNHSSGLPGSSFENGFTFAADTEAHDSFLSRLKDKRLQSDPGAYSVYSNDSFLMAELVIEAVTGKSYTETIKELFLEPLNMENTFTPVENPSIEKMARVVSAVNPQREFAGDYVNAIGTGGIFSTAEDLCRFGQVFMKDSTLLNEASLQAMANNEAALGIWPSNEQFNSINYGLGWDSVALYPFEQNGIQALSKSGDTLYSHAVVTVLPEEGLTMAILSSGGVSIYNQMMASTILEQTLILHGKTAGFHLKEMEEEPEVSAELDDSIRQYAGLYADSSSLYQIDFEEDGTMSFVSELMPAQPTLLKHLGNGEFLFSTLGNTQKFSFEEKEGHIYLKVEALSKLEGIGSSGSTVYYAEKVSDNPLSDEVAAAWRSRNGKAYFLITEKPISQLYEMILPITPIALSTMAEGYVAAHQIVDENTAQAIVAIPGTGSRDQFDYQFIQQEGIEYLYAAGDWYISEDALSLLQEGTTSITINDSAHLQWFMIDPAMSSLTLQLEGEGEVILYDALGLCVYDSVVDQTTPIVLPEGGYLAVAGEANAQFSLTVSK